MKIKNMQMCPLGKYGNLYRVLEALYKFPNNSIGIIVFLYTICKLELIHTEKSFRNLIESTRNQIVFTILKLIWIQTDVRLDPNQSENGKYNLISG